MKDFDAEDHDFADQALRKAVMDLQMTHRKDGHANTLTFHDIYSLLAEAVERQLIKFDK